MAGLDLAKLQSNPNAWILMAHLKVNDGEGNIGPRTFKAIRQEEFNISGSAEFSNPFQAHLEDVNGKWQAAGSAITSLTGVDLAIPNLKSQLQSLHHWISSERPRFQVPMTFIRFDTAQPSVSTVAKRLLAAVYPRGGDRNNINATLKNPGEYDAASADKQPKNTWTLSIGEFFRADQLIMRSAEVSFSKETVFDGSPLYAHVTCAFEPVMVPTEDDVLSWFLK